MAIAATLLCWMLSCSTAQPCVLVELTQWKSWLKECKRAQAEKVVPDISSLRDRDIVLIIDKSKSMATRDCPSESALADMSHLARDDWSNIPDLYDSPPLVSRWQWCEQQALSFTALTEPVLDAGVNVVVFSTKFEVHNGVTLRDIASIFASNKPRGTTNATRAVKSQLDNYFERRSQLGGDAKPLLIAFISDDCPDDSASLRRVIIDCTERMTSQDEIVIAMLQVGTDPRAARLFQNFKRDFKMNAAKFDIINVTGFPELRKEGLCTALVDAVRTARKLANNSLHSEL